jgi:hypothetical protein
MITRAPAARATSAEASVEASSTTRTSIGGSVWASAERTLSATVLSALRQGMMTLARMEPRILAPLLPLPLGEGGVRG